MEWAVGKGTGGKLMTQAPQRPDRKNSHLELCLERQVEYAGQNANGFAFLRFEHDALPEINKKDISLEVNFLGKKLSAPLFIGAMTGGTRRAFEINVRLAKAAEFCRVGLALGSQRKMVEDPELKFSYAMREHAPDLPLLMGNLGAVQLNCGVQTEKIRDVIKATGCDAFNFHLNPLQECIQPEGDTDFSNLLPKLKDTIPQLGVPVFVKEVGAGISRATALKLKTLPLAGIETAGLGGTSWSKIESMRTEDRRQKAVGELFARWGCPTAESIVNCRDACPHFLILASGGIRNGIEVAKSLVLGAEAAGMALPFLKAAEKSTEDVVEAIETVKEELRMVLFLTGSLTVQELKRKKLLNLYDATSQD